jgi:hypothetical protein
LVDSVQAYPAGFKLEGLETSLPERISDFAGGFQARTAAVKLDG